MSPPVIEQDVAIRATPKLRRMSIWVRGLLIMIAGGVISVFVIAIALDPYQGGRVWYEETHTQLGLPECTFKRFTKMPCPSCGMTTSFTLLMHGDPINSLQANYAGTVLAVMLLVFIPWSLASVIKGRFVWVRSIETTMAKFVAIFFVILFVRWGIVLLFFD